MNHRATSLSQLRMALRPSPRSTLIEVCIGDESLLAEVTVTGRYRPAVTQADPEHCHQEEFPEVEVQGLWTEQPYRCLSGLLEFEPVRDEVQAQCEQHVAEHWQDGPDPDEARERMQDRQMEASHD